MLCFLYDHLILSEQEGGRLMFKSEKKQRGEGGITTDEKERI